MSKEPILSRADGMTSANLAKGLNRPFPRGKIVQDGMTSANLQTALVKPPAQTPAAPATTSSGATTQKPTSAK